MPLSTYLANKLLDHQLGKTAYTMPSVYLALSTTAPTTGGTGVTEPSSGGYARVSLPGSVWTAAASGASSNASAISFPTATGTWAGGANLTHCVIFDALTGGNVLSFNALTSAKQITAGDTPIIPAGQLNITLA